MLQFFQDVPTNPFLLSGLLAGLLASFACGVVGPYVVSRRILFLVGAIAHIAIGGIGAAVFLTSRFPEALSGLRPIHGALAAALAAAVILAVVHERVAERMDTLIGALWASGMAAGILLIKFTPGYHTELMSYLFGNLVYVSWEDVRLLAVLDGVIAVVALFFHKRLMAVCIDREQVELQGVSVLGTHVVLLALVGLTVISLTQVVGLILVIALLSLPAATAAHQVARMGPMMVGATLLCALLTTLPRIAVYGTPVSPEPAIVLAAVALYLLSVAVRRLRARAGRG